MSRYSVLAAGSAGANCLAFEAVPATFEHLRRNIALNELEDRVTAHPVAGGEIIGGNNLYVRDAEILRERMRTAPLHDVHGTRI
jgi:hypothetical protein